jgi:PBP1b-binding outer membrane lipoprotein LpoB
MKKIFLGLVLSTLILSGCTGGINAPSTTKKLEQNIVTKAGTISTKVGSDFLLSTTEGIVNITSTKVNLETYLKKSVKVTGMFSGSTLYVDKVEVGK